MRTQDEVLFSFVPGTLVVNRTRMPSVNQPWLGSFAVGTVMRPIDTPGCKEVEYCRFDQRTKVSYCFGVQFDHTQNLIAITPEQDELTWREKIRLFLGEEALATHDRHCGSQP